MCIKLSNHPSDCLVVHGAVVARASAMLAAASSPHWGAAAKLDVIVHPTTQNSITLKTLALMYADRMHVLEGKV